MHDELSDFEHDKLNHEPLPSSHNPPASKTKPHVVRRNIEDYLEKKQLARRLKDVFDEDFLLD